MVWQVILMPTQGYYPSLKWEISKMSFQEKKVCHLQYLDKVVGLR